VDMLLQLHCILLHIMFHCLTCALRYLTTTSRRIVHLLDILHAMLRGWQQQQQ
jgi:hypothetical protein